MDSVNYLGKRKGKDIYKVYHGGESYKVEFKDGSFYNMGYWNNPKRKHFEREEDFIEAESIDSHTFFAVRKIVDSYIEGF